MLILADSDVVRKLAFCELLLDFHQLMVIPPDQMRVLPALKHQLFRKLEKFPAALANFKQFLTKVADVPIAQSDWIEFFSDLDVGEQQLFSLLCQGAAQEIVTGDKNCLAAVSGLCVVQGQLKTILDTKKIWCFEAIVLRFLEKRGFSIVNARMQKWRGIQGGHFDAVMNQAFPPTGGSLENSKSVLLDFVSKLQSRAPLVVLNY